MLATFTDEQTWLRELVAKFAEHEGLDNPADLGEVDHAGLEEAFGKTGLTGIRRRDSGGVPGSSGVEVAIVVSELAYRLVPAAYLTSGALGLELLELSGAPHELRDSVAGGDRHIALCLSEDLSAPAPVTGASVAYGSPGADLVVGLADDGTVMSVPATVVVPGSRDCADLTRFVLAVNPAESDITRVGVLAGDARHKWLALALTAVSADIVGAARGALDRVVGYSADRQQYGVPIGSFQAVQHLCAKAHVAIEAAWSLTKYAAWAVDELLPAEALLAARAAKACAGAIARTVPETVMQVYGGIGQTWENIAHLHLRRCLVDRELLGAETAQHDAIANQRMGES